MALRSSELIFILRAQNNASATIRRVSADMKSLQAIQSRDIRIANAMSQTTRGMAKNSAAYAKQLQIVTQRERALTTMRRGSQLSHAGRASAMFGLIGVAAAGAAASSFAGFDTKSMLAATQAASTVSDVLNKNKLIQAEIMKQMEVFPANADQMAAAAYQIFSSMNVGFGEGLGLLKQFNKVAVAGQTDLATATNVSITVLNDFKGASNDVSDTLNRMFAIVKFGRITFAQFDAMMNKVAPAAKLANQSLTDVGGAMALLTQLMPSSAQAGTSLARMLNIFGNADFIAGLKKTGVEVLNASGNMRPLVDVMNDIIARFPELASGGPKALNFFKTITALGRGSGRGISGTEQARRGFGLLITNMQLYNRLQKSTATDNNEFAKSFNTLNQSLGVRWQVFINQLRVVTLLIGEAAIPVFIRFGNWIKNLVDKWRDLDPHTRNAIVRFAVWTGILMTLGGIIMTVVGSLISFAGMLALLSTTLGASGGAAGLIGRMLFILGLFRLLSGIGIIYITIKLLFAWPNRNQFFNDLDNRIKGAIDKMPTPFGLGKGLQIIAKSPFDLDQAMRADALKAEQTKKTLKEIQKPGGRTFGITRIKKPKKPEDDLMTQIKKAIADAKSLTEVQALVDAATKKTGNDAVAMANQVGDAADKMKQDIKTAAENLASQFNTMKEANASTFGALFTGPVLTGPAADAAAQFGIKPGAASLVNDLKAQVKAFTEYRKNLSAISGRGAPTELVQELQNLGPDAADKLDALRKASPKMFAEFVSLWKQKQAVIKKATDADFKNKLKQWFKFGKGIAQNIILGLQSEDVALSAAMEKYIYSKFPGLIAQAKAEAVKEFKKSHPAAASDKPVAGLKPTTRATSVVHAPTTVVVHADKGETNAEAARRAKWILTQKRKR